jgi:hypothetical protein
VKLACIFHLMADISKQLSAHFAELGRKGGKARLKKISAAERKRIARNAVNTRWAKAKQKKTT